MVHEWRIDDGDRPPPGATHVIGVDEAGRGPVIGPLVVAALAVPVDGGEDVLRGMGVRDSKKLQVPRRDRLYAELVRYPHAVVEVPAEDIDAMRETATMNVIEARLFASAVLKVLAMLGAGVRAAAYIDAADTSELVFERRFRSAIAGDPLAGAVVHVVCRHKADDTYPVVSAASIVAKGRREDAVARIKSELGQDFGTGYTHDRATIAFLEKWITEKGNLPPHTRTSWRTAQRIVGHHPAARGSLDDFTEGGNGQAGSGDGKGGG
jgi:ribonuclease HII